MIIKLPVGTYGRFVGTSFCEEELQKYIQELDYFTAVSYSEFPKINGITSIDKHCAIIPIQTDMEKQIFTYKKRARNEIHRTYRSDDYSVEINCTPPDELYKFHALCEAERQWKPVPPEELKASLIICVRFKGELIAGMSAYAGVDVLRIGRIFSRRQSDEYQNLQSVVVSAASRRVVHEFALYANKNNIRQLDLSGIDPNDSVKNGITQYKLSFGSNIRRVWYGRYYGPNYVAINEYANKNNYDIS